MALIIRIYNNPIDKWVRTQRHPNQKSNPQAPNPKK
jgi:hypothetical protein